VTNEQMRKYDKFLFALIEELEDEKRNQVGTPIESPLAAYFAGKADGLREALAQFDSIRQES